MVNAQGTSTTSETVTTTLTGTVEAIATNITITPLLDTSGITGTQYSTSTPAPVVGLPPQNYSFTPTITANPGFTFTSGPTFNPPLPATGSASVDTTVTIAITGTVATTPPLGTQLLRCDNSTTNHYTPTTNISSGFTYYSAGGVCYRSMGNTYSLAGLSSVGTGGTVYPPGAPGNPCTGVGPC